MLAAMEKLFAAMVANGELALVAATAKSAERLAKDWGETGQQTKLADWLIEQASVDDVYVDADLLESRMNMRLREAAEPANAQKENRAAKSAFEPSLAEAIYAAPEDLDARAVYADWLQEQGDPRGELMLLQIAQSHRPNAKLRLREREILALHRRHFFGELAMEKEAGDDRVHVTLANGFFAKATVPNEHALRKLLELESSRFLTSLEILCRSVGPIDTLLASRRLPLGLRELRIALPVDPRRVFLRTTCLGEIELGRALTGLCHLTRIEVHASRIRLESLASTVTELILDAEKLEIAPELAALVRPKA